MTRCRTLSDLANRLGVTARTLSRWRREWGGFPEASPDGWSLEEVRRWHAGKQRERLARKRTSHRRAARAPVPDAEVEGVGELEQASLDLDTEQKRWATKYRRAKAEQEELRLEQLRGSLIPRAEVESMFAARVHEIAAKLDGLGRSLAPQLAGLTPREIEDRINDATRAIREHFARARPIS